VFFFFFFKRKDRSIKEALKQGGFTEAFRSAAPAEFQECGQAIPPRVEKYRSSV